MRLFIIFLALFLMGCASTGDQINRPQPVTLEDTESMTWGDLW